MWATGLEGWFSACDYDLQLESSSWISSLLILYLEP